MNEFLDQKDSGTAILSHFYLLSGCAITVWLEGLVWHVVTARPLHLLKFCSRPSRLLHFTGILVLGVGDALVSHSYPIFEVGL